MVSVSQSSLGFPLQVDSLIEAFGTNKQKRALTSRRLNQVGTDTLHHAVAKAANTVIDQKGLEGKLHCRFAFQLLRHIYCEKYDREVNTE